MKPIQTGKITDRNDDTTELWTPYSPPTESDPSSSVAVVATVKKKCFAATNEEGAPAEYRKLLSTARTARCH